MTDKVNLINLFHFYQPYDQDASMLHRIVKESYEPVFKGFLERPHSRAVFNITGCLLQRFDDDGFNHLLDMLHILLERKQIEFMGTSMYHTFLPLLPSMEIRRQIELNDIVCKKYFGELYNPKGFYPPELGVNNSVLEVVRDLGYTWIASPYVALSGDSPKQNKLYKDKASGLVCMLRNKIVSSLMLSAAVHSSKDLRTEASDLFNAGEYWFTAMDGETFGHHRVHHESFLFDVLEDPCFNTTTVSDLLNTNNYEYIDFEYRASTWTNKEQDFWLVYGNAKKSTSSNSFILWKDPSNPIHTLQWDLTNRVIDIVNQYSDKDSEKWHKARHMLDYSLASDHFWWASAKPWWSLELIELGAYRLLKVVEPIVEETAFDELHDIYRQIVDIAFDWQRSKKIHKMYEEMSTSYMREPLKMRTSLNWYNQLLLELEYEMQKSISNLDLEKAILYRDSINKIHLGTDVFDIVHVIDLLWIGRNFDWNSTYVKPFLDHDWDEFSDLVKTRLLGVSCKQDFEDWKIVGDERFMDS